MNHAATFLSSDAVKIWKAGVAAVDSESLIHRHLRIDDDTLVCDEEQVELCGHSRVEVVGAGKAGGGMAAATEAILLERLPEDRVSGWLNVPADCVRDLRRIHLHAGRPAGLNEPTAEGVRGTREILDRVSRLQPQDVCIVLISGGGSALLPAPIPEITLKDKQIVTRLMAAGGASIEELNQVRRHLSQIKGGGLLRHCGAGTVLSLIISDVIGDPLSVIASGPTVAAEANPADALRTLRRRAASPQQIPDSVIRALESGTQSRADAVPVSVQRVLNRIIGNNRTAIEAAAVEARACGYLVVDLGSTLNGEAKENGRLFELLTRAASGRFQAQDFHEKIRHSFPDAVVDKGGPEGGRGYCLLSGGEPIVHLKAQSSPGKGGRNQELVLAAIASASDPSEWCHRTLLSGGTDGEDGPTNAAGAFADEAVVRQGVERSLDPESYLAENDSYSYFERAGGHLITGPTHTNVMDVRVALMSIG